MLGSVVARTGNVREEIPVVRVVQADRQQLEDRREEVLARHGVTLDEFAERAEAYALVGDEWEAWDELRGIAFLLDDE